MKRAWSIILTAVLFAALLTAAGCKPKPTAPSPSPVIAVTPKPSAPLPTPPPEPSSVVPPVVSPAASPGTTVESTIKGFEEGKVVKAKDVPEVEKAVKAKYKDAKIKSITMETYENKQIYHVILEAAVDGNKDLCVTSDGVVTPMTTPAP
ncbi:MAG: hypothetical protein RR232_04710 [Clostridia bacterium]